jgi:uncharacterized protein YdhG (YjbR/CyaY superfamily)
MDTTNPTTIDEYIASFPEEIQDKLQKIRQTVRQAAPEAQETIKYRMPTFELHGNLVHFAAFKQHIGFYPAPSGIESFQKELAMYKSSKGAIQFPLDKPIPYGLIAEIVRFRVKENLQKAEKKKGKKSGATQVK